MSGEHVTMVKARGVYRWRGDDKRLVARAWPGFWGGWRYGVERDPAVSATDEEVAVQAVTETLRARGYDV